MNKDVKEKVSSYKEEMINEIIKYVNMDTVWKPEECDKEHPFGKEVSRGFKLLAEKAKNDGFDSSNVKNMAMDISLGKKSDDYIGIVCHFDVVPVNTELWTKDPFDGWSDDKFIYGRGSQDDKGPLIAVYYAMKIIKELNIPLKREVRLIIGGNEETKHLGVDEYLKHNSAPTYGFTADGDFPVINVEKGTAPAIARVELPKGIISIEGGTVINAVAPKAKARILADDDIEEKFMEYIVANGLDGAIEKGAGFFDLLIRGKTAHGSLPETGVNAITHLLNFINIYRSNDLSKFVASVYHNNHFADGFDLKVAEEQAKLVGQSSVSLNIIKTIGNKVEIHHDLRFPSFWKNSDIAEHVKEKYNQFFDKPEFEDKKIVDPLYKPTDHELTSTLLNAYNSVTGENAEAKISGGATYAKDVPNILAFGMMFPDTVSTMHGPNEALPIRDLVVGTEIFVKAIVDLANK